MTEAAERFADRLWATGRLTDPAVYQAFRGVPRELFLPGRPLGEVYADDAIVTKRSGAGEALSSSSQPAMMAIMLDQLALRPGLRVLEIGAGTGYNAALIAAVVGRSGSVVSVDIDTELVRTARDHLTAAGLDRVAVQTGDGARGWPGGAPYDRILLTVAAADLAPAWRDQLTAAGRLVLPLTLPGTQQSLAFVRHDAGLRSVDARPCGFIGLRGALADPAREHDLGGGRRLRYDGDPPGPLGEPGQALAPPVAVSRAEAVGPLALWLSLRLPGLGQLSSARSDRPPSPVLVGSSGSAVLAADSAGVTVRGFGAGAAAPIDRLVEEIRAWDRAGRRCAVDVRFGPDRPSTAAYVIDRTNVRLAQAPRADR